jgi:hypothetical protein
MRIEIKKHPKLTELASDGDFIPKKKLKTLSNMLMNAGLW